MALVSGYDNEIFISYSHIDNEPFGDPRGGWVDIFHEQLQNFVNVHLGRRARLWRDKRLTGNEVFSDEIEQQLRRSAILVSVISPGYMRSEWCNRELLGFATAAQSAGTLRVGNLQRVVKVLRLPVERSALPPLLDEVLGGQFYREDPASGRARDLLLDPSADARQVFLARVDDVAQDLSRLLEAMAATGHASGAPSAPTPAAPASAGTVFLAWTTSDLTEEREKLRRELEARHYRVVPAEPPPLDAASARDRIHAALSDANVAVYLLGARYGFVPEGEERSIIELQGDDDAYRDSATTARVVWFAPNMQPHPRLSALVDRMQQPSTRGGHIDVVANQSLETLKSLVLDRLNPAPQPLPRTGSAAQPVVYLVCDQLDRDAVAPIQDFLFDRALEPRLPLFEGDTEEIRSEHYATLSECAGVLLFWGKSKESWLRNVLRDLNKVFGLGRTEPYKAAALYLAGLPDPRKDLFRTHQVSILRPASELDTGVLSSFTQRVIGG